MSLLICIQQCNDYVSKYFTDSQYTGNPADLATLKQHYRNLSSEQQTEFKNVLFSRLSKPSMGFDYGFKVGGALGLLAGAYSSAACSITKLLCCSGFGLFSGIVIGGAIGDCLLHEDGEASNARWIDTAIYDIEHELELGLVAYEVYRLMKLQSTHLRQVIHNADQARPHVN